MRPLSVQITTSPAAREHGAGREAQCAAWDAVWRILIAEPEPPTHGVVESRAERSEQQPEGLARE